MSCIKIKDLCVEIDKKPILKNINLDINDEDIVVILGPNGNGKSTLFKTILKHYSTNITNGDILINNQSILNKTTDEIVDLGVYLSSQNPIEIPGLKTFDLLRAILNKKQTNISVLKMYQLINNHLKELGLDQSILERNINENFSGGERKKIEILQLILLGSDIILLDEIDSGLDADAINAIGNVLLEFKKQHKTIVFISHNEKLIKLLKPNKAILLVNGQIVKEGTIDLAYSINQYGYKKTLCDLNIRIEQIDDELKDTNSGFYCKNAK